MLSNLSTLLFLLLVFATSVQAFNSINKNNNANNNNHGASKRLQDVPRSVRSPASSRYHGSRPDAAGKNRSEKPNIVFIITDDQDVELGSLNYMPKTARYLKSAGTTFKNAFSTTPMCCPSRSSMLTGMYVHNHNTYTNNDNCSSPEWRATHEVNNFGRYLQEAGYHTGYFGKYLNEYAGHHVPVGWTEWMGLVKNTRYYNYTLNHNGSLVKHKDDYHSDYLTDVVARASLKFFRRSKKYYPTVPIAMVLSMPAPHGPEDSAPQYQHLFTGAQSHRTPTWNKAPNLDKQWLLQYTKEMTSLQKEFTDVLQMKRLQTLQSVDDAVEKIWETLVSHDELENTYVFYSSDHGYHLGQYGLVKGKAMPYDFDIKVPFMVRGPGVPKNVTLPNIVLNLDLAPTFLDIAGIPPQDHMDGASILKTFSNPEDKLTPKKLQLAEKLEAQVNNLTYSKERRVEEECKKPEYQHPCKPNQKWKCLPNNVNKLRFFKCHGDDSVQLHSSSPTSPKCRCRLSRKEKQLQFTFLKLNVNQPEKLQPNFIKDGVKRVKRRSTHQKNTGIINIQKKNNSQSYSNVQISTENGWSIVTGGEGSQEISVPCRIEESGATVECHPLVYENYTSWQQQKDLIGRLIGEYNSTLFLLSKLNDHIREYKPRTPGNATLLGQSDDDVTDCICDNDAAARNKEEAVKKLNWSPWFVKKKRKKENSTKNKNGLVKSDHQKVFQKREESVRDVNKEEETTHGMLVPPSKRATTYNNSQNKNKNRNTWPSDCATFNNCSDTFPTQQQRPRHSSEVSSDVVWDLSAMERHYKPRNDPACNIPGLECFRMDSSHWKVKPFWEREPFCACCNSNNNTYWCLRTVNSTHDFLYCEFITGFISFYDMTKDPHQARNAVLDLSYDILHQLHRKLEMMKSCRGAECNDEEKLLKSRKAFNGRDTSSHRYPKTEQQQRKQKHLIDNDKKRW